MAIITEELLIEKTNQLGVDITEDQAKKMIHYAELLQKWNKTYNLTSISQPEDILNIHLLDSLSMIKVFNQLYPHSVKVLDVGSGGGLPAIPLAIMRPDVEVVLTDAVKKKTLFQRQVILENALKNAKSLHTRIETLNKPEFDVVTSRAFASLKDTVLWSYEALTPCGRWLSMKAKVSNEEMSEIPMQVQIETVFNLELPGQNITRKLIVMKKSDTQ